MRLIRYGMHRLALTASGHSSKTSCFLSASFWIPRRNCQGGHRDRELLTIGVDLRGDLQIRAFGICRMASCCCGWAVHGCIVHRWPLRARLVSGARGGGIRLRRGNLARPFAYMGLLFGADSFSRRAVFSELPERGPQAARRGAAALGRIV